MLARLVGLPVLFLLGAVTGVAGTFASRHHVLLGGPGGFSVPWGFGLAIAGAYGLFHTGGRLFGTSGVLLAAFGWLASLLAFMVPRGDSDLLVPQDWLGIGFLFGGVIAAMVAFGRTHNQAPEPTGNVDGRVARADRPGR